MKKDIEIAQNKILLSIDKIAKKLNINEDEIELYGKYKAKLSNTLINRLKDRKDGKLILVTAINPTPAGEGKTTITVGLGDALCKLGKETIIALREPSLGPCMGMKGGATGGGYAQVIPMEDINLHFTGDIHAITAAHNLISAMLDNSLYFGNPLNIDINNIKWQRALDINDRSLRSITIGSDATLRRDGFIITVASEIMAILCLAKDIKDLRERIAKIIVAYNKEGEIVTVKDLKCVGAVVVLLKDAMKPNLVQTLEENPVIIHGGPFANIAHGCNSVIATNTAIKLAEYVVTEAGFGADLGAEKFFDIKCRVSDIKPSIVVLVATIRALKYNGNVNNIEDDKSLERGIANLEQHIENLKKYNLPVVVTLNQFSDDTKDEIDFVRNFCKNLSVDFALATVWENGGSGGIELAKTVLANINRKNDFKLLYNDNLTIKEKIETIAKEIYRADGVIYNSKVEKEIEKIGNFGFSNLPICIAKTQYSFSDNPKLLAAPRGFKITISDIKLSSGAGFIVAIAGSIMTMPGLPKKPAAEDIDLDDNGNIVGLF